MGNAFEFGFDDLLAGMGLQRRRSAVASLFPAVGLMAVGAIVGAGMGLVFAPSSGRRLRQEVGERLEQIRERVKVEQKKNGMATGIGTTATHTHEA